MSSVRFPAATYLRCFLASGLAMCNHHTFVFVGAPLALRSLWIARRNLGAKGVALALGFGLLGLVPYLYLMSASASAAAVSWGDETSIDGLVALVLRRDYGTFSMGRPTAERVFVTEGTFFPTLWHMWGRAFPRLLWFGPLLALAGLYLGMKSRPTRKAACILLFVFCFYGLTYCSLSNLSIARPSICPSWAASASSLICYWQLSPGSVLPLSCKGWVRAHPRSVGGCAWLRSA